MKNKTQFLIILLIFFQALSVLAQNYYDKNFTINGNNVFNKDIHSVQIYKTGWELSYPVIELESDEFLEVHFDDLSGKLNNYSFTIQHCNADWTTSELMFSDYINGFSEVHIKNHKSSFNTTISYVHYKFDLPNDNYQILLSGNYIVKVFPDEQPDSICFTRRFSVVEKLTEIEGQVIKPSWVEYREKGHELDFTVDFTQINVFDPENDVKVIVTQNNIWNTALTDIKPTFMQGNTLTFNDNRKCVFLAGNQFRFFDIKNKRFRSRRVADYQYVRPYYHVRVIDEEIRNGRAQDYHEDINGKYIVEIESREESDVEADYFFVHFHLPYEQPKLTGRFYITGAFSGFELNDNYKLEYSFERKAYEITLLLKQGYYNYEYIYVDNQMSNIDRDLVEGSYYNTENDYLVYVYFKDKGLRYDRLIGFRVFNSVKRM